MTDPLESWTHIADSILAKARARDERLIRATIAWFDDHGEYLGHYESIIDYDAIIATAEEPE